MPLALIALGAAFVGSQIDNAVKAKFGTPVIENGFSTSRVLVTGALLVFIGLGVKKILK